jgi:hypothetical protein
LVVLFLQDEAHASRVAVAFRRIVDWRKSCGF